MLTNDTKYTDTIQKYFPWALVLVVLFFSTYRLTESPPVWYDEGIYHQSAINLLRAGDFGLQVEPDVFASASNSTVGFPLIYPVALSFGLFDVGVLQARSVMVVFILLLVFYAYFLLKNLFGFKVAAYSSSLLATFPVLYGNGKSTLGEVPGMFFLILFLFFIYKLEESDFKDIRWYILAGLAGGLCVVTKPIFFILLPALAFSVFFLRKKITFIIKPILIFVFAFLIPVALWISTQFKVSDSLPHIFAFYATPSGVGDALGLVVDNMFRLISEASPAFLLLVFLAWAFSVFIRRLKISLAECTAFFFSFLILVAYLRTLGWYRYFFEAQILSLIFLPYALYSMTHTRRFAPLIITILIALNVYQLGFRSFTAEYYTSTATADIERYLSLYPINTSFFVYNAPEVVIFLPSGNYYQYIKPRPDQIIGEEQLGKIEAGVPDEIIIYSNTYEQIKDEFVLYAPKDRIGRYTILKKI
ncbi:glycosyltransferase family 39 protein [Candidatus Kaiserbacteria bacterium]|nr:glycosyltransferase family 39 protein [Candidatus Kaiserbacteria bacterium]